MSVINRRPPERPPEGLRHCERCGFATYRLHCKIRCANCGHFLDCGDLEIPGGSGRVSGRLPPNEPKGAADRAVRE